jgi:hypothetical protein
MRHLLLFLLASMAALAPTGAAMAQPQQASLRIELNRLEAQQQGCRVWLVVGNSSSDALDSFRLDLVLFGRDGVVARRVAVEAGPLPAEKTSVRLFDLAGLPCDGVGMVLLNDLLACNGTEAPARASCLGRLAVASRVPDVRFEK